MAPIGQLLVVLFACTFFYVVGNYCLGQGRGGTDDESNTTPTPVGWTRTHPSSDSDRAQDPPSAVRCRACRTENDPVYTYCRECVSELHGQHDRRP
jgi:hypothetical protein